MTFEFSLFDVGLTLAAGVIAGWLWRDDTQTFLDVSTAAHFQAMYESLEARYKEIKEHEQQQHQATQGQEGGTRQVEVP